MPHRRRFFVLCVGIWLHAADSLVTATIAPAIVDGIGGIAFINWTIMLYEVGAIVAAAVAPMLCRRLGVKRVLGIAALAYGGGCVVAGFAPNMGVLLAGRLAQGMGGGMLLSLCYLAIQEWFAQSWWSRLFGIVALIWGAGSLLGPLIGGIFAGLHAWRLAFFAFAVQAVVLGALASLWLPTQAPSRQPAKRWSVLPLLVLSTATMLIAESSVTNSIRMSVLGSLLGASLLYLAARLDRGASSRLFPVQVLDFRHPVGAGLLMVFALSAATTGFWAYGPLILKILFGTQPLISGYILAGEAVAWRPRDRGRVEGATIGGPMVDPGRSHPDRTGSRRLCHRGTGRCLGRDGSLRASAGPRLRPVLAVHRAPDGTIVGCRRAGAGGHVARNHAAHRLRGGSRRRGNRGQSVGTRRGNFHCRGEDRGILGICRFPAGTHPRPGLRLGFHLAQ